VIEKQQLAFGDALRRLRIRAGYETGKQFATALGWQPSKVSRIESGRTLPDDEDVIAWLEAIQAPDATLAEMRDRLRDLRLARASWRRRLRSGHTPAQVELGDRERTATHLVQVEFFVVPGLVQTAEYARALFAVAAEMHSSPPDLDAAVLARMRRQEVLYDPAKTVEILVGESALRYPIAARSVMVGQLDRIANLTGLPTVRLGVIPLDERLPVVALHGHLMLDNEVVVEVNHTDVPVTDPEDVALYRLITDRLWSVALEGDRARALLARIAADVRSAGG
jgi:transcriptional regulator with XRE-family HTH domain